jgi:hypothetical protein
MIMKNKNQQLICKALGLTDLSYSEMVFEYATLWFNRYFFNNDIMVNALEASPSFWAWWKNQWEIRNERFICEANLNTIELPLEVDCKLIALGLYYDAHDVMGLQVFPNKLVRIEAGREIIKQYETIKSLKK